MYMHHGIKETVNCALKYPTETFRTWWRVRALWLTIIPCPSLCMFWMCRLEPVPSLPPVKGWKNKTAIMYTQCTKKHVTQTWCGLLMVVQPFKQKFKDALCLHLNVLQYISVFFSLQVDTILIQIYENVTML